MFIEPVPEVSYIGEHSWVVGLPAGDHPPGHDAWNVVFVNV